MIYASEHDATAMLEKLAQCNGTLPDNQHFVEIAIPRGTSCEVATLDSVTGWDSRDCEASRRFAAAWYAEKQSAVLFVPSFVARLEQNIVCNTLHPEFRDIAVSLEAPVWWDQRLLHGSWPRGPAAEDDATSLLSEQQVTRDPFVKPWISRSSSAAIKQG